MPMPPDLLRGTLLAGVLAFAAGCTTTGGQGRPDQPTPSASASMSNSGLSNLRLAQSYLASDKLEVALDRANRALRSDPGSADVQLVLGMIREKLGEEQRAGEHYARAAKLAPDLGHVQNVWGAWLCERGQPEQADAAFALAVKDPFYKSRDQAYFNAGKCAMQAGQLDKAERHFRSGLESAPENPLLLARMAELKFRQGDFFGARAFYQRREALGEPDAKLLDLAANIEQGAGDTVAAERYRRKLREQYPDYTPPGEGLRQP